MKGSHRSAPLIIPTFVLLILGIAVNEKVCIAGITSKYIRRPVASVDLPIDSPYFAVPPGHNAPEQVHLTQGDRDGQAVIVSWVTPLAALSTVSYGLNKSQYNHSVTGTFTRYSFYNYTSRYIHQATLRNLQFGTTYYYRVGSGSSYREFLFTTPPPVAPDSPYIFGVIGDLGQTYDSLKTFQHYLKSQGKAVLYVGDLSYADHYPFDNNVRWDTWGRLVEPSTAYQPWIWTAGNHEIEFLPEIGEVTVFKPFLSRYPTPYFSSDSTSPLWYSIRRASAHIIVLSSYSAYGKYTPQWVWLQAELTKVDRTKTPWLIVLMHLPMYNSNTYHYMEGETFRVQFESWFVNAKVDIIFAGHVHAYERSNRISNVAYNITNKACTPVFDNSAPVYVTIGDGGNIEGIAGNFTEPQPQYSAYREASFGHGIFDIKNRTHAYFNWHRNQDGEAVVGDSYLLLNRLNAP
ncbi:hypothetical protein O6H91_01G059000 [Diphasiastrum complanatum]|uniref:Uncharacterized protein n=11 Tax=Diphasiastrum complanatum TaxID=34168 RepID=A0ACC2ERD6_DIPCM|nr:hypothetical protein O6H91_01G059000 [Diphasiastrum complanatum]KAJ7569041.1 hypothetical protein O6H91_01G059000 [Diphasiastrum complanatum]KAJ7569042.1 hypothetical protein O6H91_01G059000 [Diphasiastrum complanatum]KAJ7569043.1 hypothetical protein O6H91_01G059000 [Diphasiastrum complanatum]KAJ7569044.1 hypothetical protein O6H91_01G059000 [Diphasiastrum complanatum]